MLVLKLETRQSKLVFTEPRASINEIRFMVSEVEPYEHGRANDKRYTNLQINIK